MNRSVGQTTSIVKRAVFLVSFLCVAAQTIIAQPLVDSIRYNEPNQSIIIIHLNEDVTYTPTSPASTPDWEVYHNGVAYPAVYLNARGVLDPPNIIRLTLDLPITYSEAHTGTGITVTYLGTGAAITGTTGTLAAFGPTDAINNLPMECEMFDPSRFDYSLALTEICAPASVEYTTAFYVQRHYINSIYYDKDQINIITRWGDTTEDLIPGAEVSPGKFEYTFSHIYPDDPSVCYWESVLLPSITGIGSCTGGGLRKTFVYENHATDEEGDGDFRFHTDTIRVCLGQDVNEIFTDATYFNCNPQTEPDFANDGLRAVRFTYGTNVSPEPRIQDIFVDGNPLGAPITGPIVYYDSIRSTGVPAPSGWSVSDPISHAFNAGTDLIGQVFEIQMENWGPCNNIFLGEPPIITYAYIKFVEGPIANPGPDFTICADASATMAGAIEQTSTGGFWSTNTGDGTWTNPNQPSGAVYTPGANDLVNGGAWLVLTADDGPGGCPEHQDSMYLSFEPALDPGNIAASQSLCQGDIAAAFTSTAPASGGVAPTYQWYSSTAEAGPYTTISGENGTTYDENALLPVGNYYYFRQARSAGVCAPINTDTLSIIVNPGPPTTPQNPVNDSPVCEDGTVTVDVDDAPTAAEYIWDVSWDGVSGDEDTTTTVSEVSFDLTGVAPGSYTVRVMARNSCGDSPWSVTTTIVINPTPNALPTPPTQTIADSAATDILMGGDEAGTIFSWRVLDPGTTNASDGGPLNIGDRIQQTLYNTTTAPVSITYRIGPSANGCPGDSADVEVIIDPSVDMTVVNNSPDICTGGSTDIDVSSNVDGTTFSWTITDLNGLGANSGTGVGPYTGISIQDNLVNTGTAIDSVIYHITPTGPAPTNITGATQNIKVYVYPEPEAEPVNHLDSICNGSQTDIEMAADVAGSTFTWTVNDPGGTTGATASASAVADGFRIQQTLDNTGSAPITVEYIITPTGPAPGSCPGDPVTVEVVVDPTPMANINNIAPEICSEAVTDIILNATVANSTFTWLMADPKGTGAVGGSGAAGDSISQQLVNSTASPVDIIWEIRINGPGTTACPGTTVYEGVTINPLPDAAPVSGADTVCELTDNVIFQTTVESDSYVEWFVPASLGTRTLGGSGIGSNAVVITTANIPGPAFVTDSLWVLETNDYGCTNDTIYKPLTLVPNPDPSVITGNENVCAYSTHTYSVPENPGSTYQWYIPQGAGFSTNPTLHEVVVTFGVLSGQVRVTETTPTGCTTNHITKNITVSPLPVSTLNVDKPAICEGELVTFTAGPLTNVTNYEFFLNSTSVQSGPGNTWTSITLANDDTVRVNVTSTNGCDAFAPPVIMTVQPEPAVTLTSSAPANTICAGGSVTFEATSADAVLYNFFLNGVSRQSGPLYFWTTSPGTITDGDEVYVAVQNAAGCSSASDTIATTVNPLPVASIDGDHDVCPGTTVDIAVSITTGISPYSITIDNGIGTLPGYLDGTNIQVTPLTSTTYSLTEITDANGCTSTAGANITGSAVVTHLDTVQILTQPYPAEVCEGTDTSFTVGAIGAGRTYEWFTAATGAGPFTPVAASNSATLEIVAPSLASEGTQYYVVVSGTCDSEVSDTVDLQILSGANVARGPYDAIVCEDLYTGFGLDADDAENADYQWYLSTDNGATWLPLTDTSVYTGTHTDSLRISSASSRFDGYMYYAEIIGICGGSVPSESATLTVYERPEILAFPEDVTICEGSPATFSIDAGVTTDPIFSWYVDMRDGTGFKLIGTDSAGVYQGSVTATLTVLNAGPRFDGYRYHAIVRGPYCTPPQVSSSALLSVHETPAIVVQPENDTICEFGTAGFSVSGTGGGLSYQWYESTDGGTSFAPVSDTGFYIGAGQPNMLIFNVNRSYDSYLYRAVVNGTCPPGQQSVDVSLTVHTAPVITASPVDLTVCDGDEAVFSVVAEGTGMMYQWKVNRNDGSGYVNIQDTDPEYTGAETPTLTKLTTDAATENGFSYRVQVYGPCSPAELTDPVFLNVNSLPQINVQPGDAAICAGEATQFRASASGPGLVFQWMVSTDGGSIWTALSDDDVYDGTGNDQLWITNSTPAMDGNLYRLDVSSSCAPTATDAVELTVWGNPSANITGDLASFPQLCGGELLTMDGNPTGGSGTYTTHRWSGDVLHVTPTNQRTAQFRTNVKGDYNINYTVTDDRGCSGRAIVVLRNFTPTAEFTTDAAPSCGDLTVNFTNRSSADAVSFDWDFDNGATSTEEHPSETFANDDPTSLVAYYNVLMVATDAQGCRDTARSLVTIYPKVDPKITATPQSGCQPLEVLLETKPGAASYLWDYGDGTGENGSYATKHVYTNLGTTTRTFETVLQTTSAYGCMATDTVEIVVDPVPQPNFSISPPIQVIPESGSAQVTITNLTADGPWTFEYNFGDGSENYTTTSFADVEHTYDAAGIYLVTLYTSVGECIDSASTVVTVNPRPPLASFTSITEGCHPLEVVFTNTSKHADSYIWQFGDGSVSTEEHPVHMFYQPGEYTVKLLAKGPGGTDQTSVVITVNPTPQVFFNYAPDSVFVNDKPVRFFNLTSYADEYYWDFGDVSEYNGEVDSENNSTLADPTHVYMFEGWKDVLLIGSNPYCVDSLFIPMAVKVIPAGVLQFPTVFRPGDSPVSGVNVNDLADGERNTVFFPGVNRQVQEYHLYIYNRWGELIFESEDINTGWDGFVEGEKAAQGVYIWKVTGIYSNGSPFSEAGDVTLLWRRIPL